MSEEKMWIGEIPGRYVKTVLIKAATFKEAQHKLRNAANYFGDIEDVDINCPDTCIGHVIREDR